MTDSVDDLSAKTEKLEIDAEYDKNWCDLPNELKLECIKTMDFKMRIGLRNTSHTERELVDSQRYHFDRVYLNYRPFAQSDPSMLPVFKLEASNNSISSRTEHYELKLGEDTNTIAAYILKTCDIKKFNHYCSKGAIPSFVDILEILILPESIRTKHFVLEWHPFYNPLTKKALSSLKMCWKNVETIKLITRVCNIPLMHLMPIPSVANAKVLKIHEADDRSALEVSPLIKKWIEDDAKVGTSLQVCCMPVEIESLYRMFKYQFVSNNGLSNLRITTNNPEKHILMAMKFKELDWILTCVVIPSNLESSEYNKYTELEH